MIPGINNGINGHTDGAPDAGAFEFGGYDWTVDAGHDFDNPPNPVYSWEVLPGTNLHENIYFTRGISDWTVVSGTPDSRDRNSWNLARRGLA